VPVGIVEAIRRPVCVAAVDPADPVAALLDRRRPPGERLRALGTQRHVRDAGGGRLRQREAVRLVLTPAAQEHGLAGARELLHAEHVVEEPQAAVGIGCEQLDVVDVREVVPRRGHRSTRARRPSRS
jgi:hypothetical protein